MRLSGINYIIASEMDKILVNSVCLVLFTSTAFTNDATIYNNMARSRETDLGQNLTKIPMSTGDSDFLNAAYNRISNLEDHVFVNNNYRHVKKIFLFRNTIRNISANAFKGLKQLKVLDLSDNNITSLDPYSFKGNNKLDKLILMNNFIVFHPMQTFIVSHSIETLILSNNKIREVFGLTFLGVPNLKRLVLSGNELTALDPISFKGLGKLHFLSLSNTGVHRLSVYMFTKLPRIINLENTPLAKRFEPPLRQIAGESVTTLLNLPEDLY